MYTIYNTRSGLVRPKKDEIQTSVSFRLYGEEALRYEEVLARARKHKPRIEITEVAKFLLNLPSEADKILTEKDRLFFQIGKLNSSRVGLVAQAVDTSKPEGVQKAVNPTRDELFGRKKSKTGT